VQRWDEVCALCGADDSYLDEIVVDDEGGRLFGCSDTDHCSRRRAAGHAGPGLATSPQTLTGEQR
jgi:alpha-D-ribose 1-methylphosphonate 5-phosphate C-P lyase